MLAPTNSGPRGDDEWRRWRPGFLVRRYKLGRFGTPTIGMQLPTSSIGKAVLGLNFENCARTRATSVTTSHIRPHHRCWH